MGVVFGVVFDEGGRVDVVGNYDWGVYWFEVEYDDLWFYFWIDFVDVVFSNLVLFPWVCVGCWYCDFFVVCEVDY